MAAGWQGLITYRAQFKREVEAEVGRQVQGNKLQILTVLIRRLVEGSPRDTGEFSMGWHVSFGSPTFQNRRVPDPLAEAYQSLAKTNDWKDVVYIQNNVPHGPILEFGLFSPPNPGPSKDPRLGRKGKILVANGFSTQAPRGIIGDAVAATAQQFGLQQV